MVICVHDYDMVDESQSPNQLSNTPNSTHSSMEPLDLSKNSKTVKFVHPPTPDAKPNSAPIFGANRQNSLVERQMSVEYTYDAPDIVIQPKTEWHYRNMRDLASKHIPLLSGNGPQRTPIRVRVPAKSDRHMFLAIQLVTMNNEAHPSKVIVPVKTQVKPTDRRHDNNLDYLDFSECNPTDAFNRVTGIIYSLITPEEHSIGQKDIRVYMFNLYQSQTITKELIESQRLHMCRLAFTLCYYENDRYQEISHTSYSNFIEEKRNLPSRSSPSMCEPAPSQSVPYSMMYFPHDSPDNTKENVGFLIIPVTRPSS